MLFPVEIKQLILKHKRHHHFHEIKEYLEWKLYLQPMLTTYVNETYQFTLTVKNKILTFIYESETFYNIETPQGYIYEQRMCAERSFEYLSFNDEEFIDWQLINY